MSRTVIAVVTGAASGIGRGIAQRLARDGARVIAADLAAEALDAAVAGADRIVARPLDVSDEAAVEALFGRTVRDFGGIDALVNAAGMIQVKPLLALSAHDWRKMLDVNLVGTFTCLREAARHMQASGGGAIVNIASIAAYGPRPQFAHYAASKSAIVSLTQSAAVALAPTIRVNAIAPGVIATRMWEEIDAALTAGSGDRPGQALAARASTIPLGRPGTAEDVADVVAFLLSDQARYVTGTTLDVGGGLSA